MGDVSLRQKGEGIFLRWQEDALHQGQLASQAAQAITRARRNL